MSRLRERLTADGIQIRLDDIETQVRLTYGGREQWIRRPERNLTIRDSLIVAELESGASSLLLARKFGLTRRRIYQIKRFAR